MTSSHVITRPPLRLLLLLLVSSHSMTLTLTLTSTLTSPPHCPSPWAWLRDHDDCGRFWRCNWGFAVEMPRCPDNTLLSEALHVCVFPGTAYDDCPSTAVSPSPSSSGTPSASPSTRATTVSPTSTSTSVLTPTTTSSSTTSTTKAATTTLSIYAFCARNYSALRAHPNECQLYYNCSMQNGVVPRIHGEGARDYDDEARNYAGGDGNYRVNSRTYDDQATNYDAEDQNNGGGAETYDDEANKYSGGVRTYDVEPRSQTDSDEARAYGGGWWSYEPYLAECAYPLLYDERWQRCREAWRVDCQGKTIPVHPCDYRNSSCHKHAPSPTPTTTPTTTTTTKLMPIPTWPFSINEYCARNQTALMPHPHECQMYYNCSWYYDVVPRYYEQHLQECPYPELYDVERQECREFWEVDCHARKEPVTACDYRQFHCRHPGCTPCDQVLPPCVGRGDGVRGVGDVLWTPTYVTCRAGRTLHVGHCDPDTALVVATVFSPERQRCISLYEVEKERGGLRPVCTGRPDGRYPEDQGRRDLFYVCMRGEVTGVFPCPPSKPVYHAGRRECV